MKKQIALLLLFVPSLLFAAALSQKYKDWAASPQAYFMTKEERAQWSGVVTDADAEKFIAQFVASRGADFAEQVADRATNADKYLTIGKTRPASQTLRGKVIVLLGPPSALKNELKKGRVDRASTAGGYMSAAGDSGSGLGSPGGGGGGASVGEVVAVAQQSGMSEHKSYVEYTITYAGDKLPAGYANGVTITLQADPGTGEDWAPDRAAQAKLDQLFDAVVAARATPAKPAQ
jgi:hypothetical protein